jgi:hypothetical protein
LKIFFCNQKSDAIICDGIAATAVVAIVDKSIKAHNKNRLACISTQATKNQTIFFLITLLAHSFDIIDFSIVYINKNHKA